MAAFHSAGAACGGALRPENVVLAPSAGEGGYAATLIDLKDVAMFEEDNEAERRGKGDDMRSWRCTGPSVGREDIVGVDDNAAAADPGHATRIGSPLRKRGNRRRGVGEGLPLCLGSLVATPLGLPLGEGRCRG